MTARRMDPLAAWNDLPECDQRRIGAAAIAHVLGAIGAGEDDGSRALAFEAADAEGIDIVEATLREALPAAFDKRGRVRTPPDLTRLGIRQCRACGCTDQCGCGDGCAWAAADLCTNCAPRPETGVPA